MKRSGQALILCCCLLLWGCPAMIKGIRENAAPTAELYRQKALANEKQDRLQEALLAWRVAELLDPADKKIPKIIGTLEKAIRNAARTHFQNGLDLYAAGKADKARQAFLIALRLMPTHTRARHWLKQDLNAGSNTIYEVKAGDSYSKIALKKYNDPTKAYTIAYFNSLDPRKPLMVRKRLILPELAPELILPRTDIQSLLSRAESALEQERYEEAIQLAEQVKSEVPGQAKAEWLADAANFRKGMALMQKRSYQAALDQFMLVSPSFEGRQKAIGTARKHLSRLAETNHIQKAQEALNQKDYDRAIQIAEEVLARNPEASEAISVARIARYNLGKQLIEQDENLKAIEVLSRLDPSYEDTGQLIAQARGKLNAHAEALYRSGVKHFLNEELELAIKNWKEALKLNPKHPKAAQDIEDAERLLNKWRGLEKNQ